MLTFQCMRTNFPPLMRASKIIMVSLIVLVFQSCYTMLYPPQTLPQTVTTVVSEPAMVTTIGGSGVYGWDPYWEPALPFTSYHRGYGASYYSPYNYYDYHHPHYAPVYVVSETREREPARTYNRDEKQGGARNRDLNGTGFPSSSTGSKSGSLGQGSAMSGAVSSPVSPVISNPIVAPPTKNKQKSQKKFVADPPKKRTKKVKVTKPKRVKAQKEVEKKAAPAPEKRSRTRK